MMLKEESKKQLITRATQYGVDPTGLFHGAIPRDHCLLGRSLPVTLHLNAPQS